MAIVINSTTGEIDLDQTTPGTYVVTYTVEGVSSTQNVTVNAVDNAGFSYSANSYMPTDSDPTPTITGLTGGTFSGSTGLVINSTTGEIDLSASTVASHTVTYNTSSSGSSVCPNTSTFNLVITLNQIANNYSMSFDGLNDYINIDTSQTLAPNTGDFTFSGWFYRDSSSIGNPVYFEKGAAYPSNGILVRDSGATGLIEVYYNGFGGIQFSNLTSYNTSNAWHHIALVYSESGNTLTAYVDGNSEQKSATTTLNVTDSIFIIGKRQNNTSYWLGKIDEVAIWNTALTPTQVSEIYNGTGTNLTKDLTTVAGSNLKYWNRMGD